ncbi:hypothetical protein BB561_005687 [Smittium simulii]|uniref:cAMP-dependent protein kinase n=1 Tax=Smittium simulii TaxID=133385 RepID=A0A2T9Y8Z2_9FUNG|nr:hypothetical protein BB561_005687 [Smittium simulii]
MGQQGSHIKDPDNEDISRKTSLKKTAKSNNLVDENVKKLGKKVEKYKDKLHIIHKSKDSNKGNLDSKKKSNNKNEDDKTIADSVHNQNAHEQADEKSFVSNSSTQHNNTLEGDSNNSISQTSEEALDGAKKELDIMNDPRSKTERFAIKDFSLFRTVGTGSFGRVRVVKNKKTEKYYAMKVLNKKQIMESKQVAHINAERAILAFCNCPFIKFPSPVAKFYASEVFLALKYLHSFDIIYRDLKPENLLIGADGHIKLTDLGFAKYVPDITWTLCGTPDYLAPEIIQSKGYGKSVDWYSLGVLIFEMVAGYPPFYEQDHRRLYERILANRFHWPPQFDPVAADIVRHLVTPDLSKRYGNLKNGIGDITSHPWFQEVCWEKLENKQIAPPIVPRAKKDGDTSNFDNYPEQHQIYGEDTEDDESRALFPDF